MRSALEERVHNKSCRVIPVLLPGAPDPHDHPLPRFLRRLTWVNFRHGLDDEEAVYRLVSGIRGMAPRNDNAPTSSLPVTFHTGENEANHSLFREQSSLKRQLAQHYHNLNKLKEQAAIYGPGETPLSLLNKIEAEEAEIERIKKELNG